MITMPLGKNVTFEEILERNGILVYTNKGVSMMPLLRQNRDVMVIERREEFFVGDAVLFRRENGQYVLHRICREKDGLYYIVGDNCIAGEWIYRDRLLGVLVSVKRGKRNISVTDCGYRLYVLTRPLHRLYLRVRRLAGRCLRFGKALVKKALGYGR